MKPSTIATVPKKKVHPIRFADPEYEWLKQKAENLGVSLGEVVRDLVKEKMRKDIRLE